MLKNSRINKRSGKRRGIVTDIQQNFIGDFRIGAIRNRLVVGLDYYSNANSFDRLTFVVRGDTIPFLPM